MDKDTVIHELALIYAKEKFKVYMKSRTTSEKFNDGHINLNSLNDFYSDAVAFFSSANSEKSEIE